MQNICGNAFKLKIDKINVWRDWCMELNTTYKDEAIKTLLEENLHNEFCGIFSDSKHWYAFIIEIGQGSLVNEKNQLNRIHREKKSECFESSYPIEITYALEVN